jgi:multimeric flavodoxin WrbA
MIMKVLAINGSPRKKWNTAMLLENALKGAASQGAETELVHFYDLTSTGCASCFASFLGGGLPWPGIRNVYPVFRKCNRLYMPGRTPKKE